MFGRFAGNRRRSGGGELVEVTPDMRPAERQPDVAAVGEFAVTGIAIDLQNSLEAFKMGDGPFGFAIGCVDIGNPRWIGSSPWPIIGGVGPELAGLGAAAAGIEHRRRRFIGEQPYRPLELGQQALMQRPKVPGTMTDPVRQCGPV